MTVVVTVNVQGRYRGFLASAMLEIAPGVYTAPMMTAGIRERVWEVLVRWHAELGQGSIVMTWRDPGGSGRAAHPHAGRSAEEHSGRGRGVSRKVQLDYSLVRLKDFSHINLTRGCPACAGIDPRA